LVAMNSSSLVRTSFTGRQSLMESRALQNWAESSSNLLPNPPPVYLEITLTSFSLSPSVQASSTWM